MRKMMKMREIVAGFADFYKKCANDARSKETARSQISHRHNINISQYYTFHFIHFSGHHSFY